MKNIFKRIGMVIVGFFAIILLSIGVSFINHQMNLSREDALFIPNGRMVEVNEHSMHVYSEGEGDVTLVFMSGGGTSSPVLDFKSLYSELSDQYRIVVVEKAGYGFSEISDITRDIDTILSETRAALSKVEIKGPYVLMPHSMSGIEALYWAQMYPNEIIGIVGLDMAVPDSYKEYDINMPLIKLSSFGARVGITRWLPGVAESDAMKFGTLTDQEKELYKVIFYRRTATQTMLNEIKEIKANASKVKEGGVPNIPMLMFSSNGEGTGWNADEWKKLQENYIENVEDGNLIYLDVPHYIHNFEYEKIADETKAFISKRLTKVSE